MKTDHYVVFLVGASGTGKSTLAADLSRRLVGSAVIASVTRRVMTEGQFDSIDMLADPHLTRYRDFQLQVCKEQFTHTLNEIDRDDLSPNHYRAVKIADRFIDHLAYSLHFSPKLGLDLVSTHRELIGRALEAMQRPKSLTLYLPPVKAYLQAARATRDVGLQPFLTDECVTGVDAALKGLLARVVDGDRGRVRVLDPDQRQKRLDNAVQRIYDRFNWIGGE